MRQFWMSGSPGHRDYGCIVSISAGGLDAEDKISELAPLRKVNSGASSKHEESNLFRSGDL